MNKLEVLSLGDLHPDKKSHRPAGHSSFEEGFTLKS